MVTPTEAELDLLIREAHKVIQWRAGARFCDCATQRSPAEGFGHDFDPACTCERGFIKLHWDGSPDHPAVADAKRQIGGSSTPGGPRLWHDSKGLRLTTDDREVSVTWDRAVAELTTPQEALF